MNRRKLVHLAFVQADLLVLIASLYATSRLTGFLPEQLAIPEVLTLGRLWQVPFVCSFLVAWPLVFRHFNLYRHRHMSFLKFRRYHLLDLVKATSVGTLLLIGTAFLIGINEVPTQFLVTFWLIETIATLLVREVLISSLKEIRLQGRNLRHLLIIGSNARARGIARTIKQQPEQGYALRGFVDDKWEEAAEPGSLQDDIVTDLEGLREYLKDNVVDEVVIALPVATQYEKASCVVKLCEEHGIVVHFYPGIDFLNLGSSRMRFGILNEEPIITLIPPPMYGWQLAIKRTMDLAVAVLLAIILAPVLLGTAIAIKLTSPGPALFIQQRIGLNKRKFRLYKFRTMVSNAEELQKQYENLNETEGPTFKIKEDPRITPIGKFLRRTSLDELPQLFNVILGDMSLVGPRPLPVRDYEGFDQDWHRRRFSVRPGITCTWQVSGRSSITFDRWMELDMDYINHWSLWLDIKILLETVPAVLFQRGAT